MLALLVAWARLSGLAAGEEAPDFRAFVDELNEMRTARGQRALERHAALETVASRQADFLRHRAELTFDLPGGATIDAWLAEEGYRAGISTAKLGATNQEVDFLLRSWLARPDASSDSLLHPEVRHVGLAVRDKPPEESGEVERVVVVVLSTPRDTLVRERYEALGDRSAIRRQFVEEVNRARAAFSRKPLEPDARLDAAADRFAAQLATQEGGVPLAVAPDLDRPPANERRRRHRQPDLVDLVRDERYRATRVQANELRGTVSASTVVDAWMRSAEQQGNLLSDVVRDIGTGSWIGRIEDEIQVIWVQIYARPGPL